MMSPATIDLFNRTLGYGGSLAACFMKLPLIFNILHRGNYDGLSAPSMFLETSAYIAIMCYNVYRGNALYTFGDLVATVVQNSLIVLLILYYGPMGKGFPRVFLAQFAGLCLLFLATVAVCCVTSNALQYLVIYGSAVGVVSRGSQVYHNTRRETVLGVQSPLTAVNSFVRPCIKLYYAATVTHDGWLIASNVVNVLLNFLLLLQVCWWLPQRQRVRDEQLQQKRR